MGNAIQVINSENGVNQTPRIFEVLELKLFITDPELRSELEAHPDGRARQDYATRALKIGVLALQQAQGQIDIERIRVEGDRLIEQLSHVLTQHGRDVLGRLGDCLKDYFDPASGRFNDRVERLIKKDGELEQVLRSQIGGDSSELARTLASYVGEHSPLMNLLDPDTSDGLVASLASNVEETLEDQRARILREFSLDNKEGALARVLHELEQHHGEMNEALEKRIDRVVAEFSMDNDESALSRLVGRVEKAQRQISSQFSLDEEGSALARMRRELLQVIETQRQHNERFQGEVLAKLTSMVVRKRESERPTRHGHDFEDSVFQNQNQILEYFAPFSIWMRLICIRQPAARIFACCSIS